MDSQFDLLLRDGRVIDPASGREGIVDNGISDGRIAAIEPTLPKAAALLEIVIAGKIDIHAHIYQHLLHGRFSSSDSLVPAESPLVPQPALLAA